MSRDLERNKILYCPSNRGRICVKRFIFTYDMQVFMTRFLIGREREVGELSQKLATQQHICLQGLPGVGKSAIARELFELASGEKRWIDWEAIISRGEEWRRFDSALRMTEVDLVVVDSSRTIDARVIEALLALSPSTTWLITNTLSEPLPRFATMTIGELDAEQSVELFCHVARLSCEEGDLDEIEHVRGCVEVVGGNPEVLGVVAAWADVLTPAQLREQLAASGAWSGEGMLRDLEPLGARFERELLLLSEPSRELLVRLAVSSVAWSLPLLTRVSADLGEASPLMLRDLVRAGWVQVHKHAPSSINLYRVPVVVARFVLVKLSTAQRLATKAVLAKRSAVYARELDEVVHSKGGREAVSAMGVDVAMWEWVLSVHTDCEELDLCVILVCLYRAYTGAHQHDKTRAMAKRIRDRARPEHKHLEGIADYLIGASRVHESYMDPIGRGALVRARPTLRSMNAWGLWVSCTFTLASGSLIAREFEQAQLLIDELTLLAEELDLPLATGFSHMLRGLLLYYRDEARFEAFGLMESAYRTFAEHCSLTEQVYCLHYMGVLYFESANFSEAKAAFVECFERRSGNGSVGWMHILAANAALQSGDHTTCVRFFDLVDPAEDQVCANDLQRWASLLRSLYLVEVGDLMRARAALARACSVPLSVEDRSFGTWVHEVMGLLALSQGNLQEASAAFARLVDHELIDEGHLYLVFFQQTLELLVGSIGPDLYSMRVRDAYGRLSEHFKGVCAPVLWIARGFALAHGPERDIVEEREVLTAVESWASHGAYARAHHAECSLDLSKVSVRVFARLMIRELGWEGEQFATGDVGAPEPETLEVGPEGMWFEWQGERVDLTRRGPMKKILCVLAGRHHEGTPIDVYELFESAWGAPALDPVRDAQKVYNNVSKLRSMGLEDAIIKLSDGYMLAPGLSVVSRESAR